MCLNVTVVIAHFSLYWCWGTIHGLIILDEILNQIWPKKGAISGGNLNQLQKALSHMFLSLKKKKKKKKKIYYIDGNFNETFKEFKRGNWVSLTPVVNAIGRQPFWQPRIKVSYSISGLGMISTNYLCHVMCFTMWQPKCMRPCKKGNTGF